MGRAPESSLSESLAPKGLVEIFVTRGAPKHILIGATPNRFGIPVCTDHKLDFTDCEILDTTRIHNIILNQGKNVVINSLTEYSGLALARMAVGDRGTIPSDSTVPKTPVATMTGLYNEVYRSDVEAVIKNTAGTLHEVRLVKTFEAKKIPITAFSNQAKPVLNEVSLIMIDPTRLPQPRAAVIGPYIYPIQGVPPLESSYPYNYPPTDEVAFSLRTFKSVPFEAATDMSITIRYTIYIE